MLFSAATVFLNISSQRHRVDLVFSKPPHIETGKSTHRASYVSPASIFPTGTSDYFSKLRVGESPKPSWFAGRASPSTLPK